jgi:hypothetical protein
MAYKWFDPYMGLVSCCRDAAHDPKNHNQLTQKQSFSCFHTLAPIFAIFLLKNANKKLQIGSLFDHAIINCKYTEDKKKTISCYLTPV